MQEQDARLAALKAALSGAERERDAAQQDLSRTRDELKAAVATHNEKALGYRDALIGLEKAVADKDAALSARIREMTALAAAVTELERSSAELKGRNAELESAYAKLQTLALESNKTIERFSADLRRVETESNRLARQLADQEKLEKSLRAELDDAQTAKVDLTRQVSDIESAHEVTRRKLLSASEAHELNAALELEQANTTKLVADLEQRDAKIAELTHLVDQAVAAARIAQAAASEWGSKLQTIGAEHERALTVLKQEWLEVTEDNDRISGVLEQKNAEVVESRMEIQQLRADRLNQDNEIDSLKRIVDELELELRTKRMLIASLEREGGHRPVSETTQNLQVTETKDPDATDETAALAHPRTLVAQGERYKQYPLIKQTVIVGRSADCDIRIGGSYTSRHHARIVSDQNGTTIEDLNSINGVQVNSENVTTSKRLHDGDTIQVGKNLFKFFDPHETLSAEP